MDGLRHAGGPVGEFLGVAVECPAFDQLEVEVGRTSEDRIRSAAALTDILTAWCTRQQTAADPPDVRPKP